MKNHSHEWRNICKQLMTLSWLNEHKPELNKTKYAIEIFISASVP